MSTEQQTEAGGRESRRSGPLVAITRRVENLSDTAFAYLLLSPIFLLLGTIAVYPLLRTFEFSMHADTLTGIGEFIWFDNYIGLFEGEFDGQFPGTAQFLPDGLSIDELMRSTLAVTLVFTIVSVFFETIVGFGQALVLDQDFKGRRWVRVAIIIPWAVPLVIQGILFYLMFTPNIGFAAQWFGANPLNQPATALGIVILADIWKTSAFMALLILAGLQSVDRSLYDVAKVAGATKVQQFRMITLPLVLPTVGIAVLFRSVAAMRVYGIIDAVTSCAVVPSLSCMVVATFNNNIALSSAVAFVTAVLIGMFVSVIIYQQAKEGF